MHGKTAFELIDGFDERDPDAVLKLLAQATQIVRDDPRRRGSCIELDQPGRLVMTGDLHDHQPNFRRILKLARLHETPDHYLVLHELLHAKTLFNNLDLSIRMLIHALCVLVHHPQQVMMVLSNHDLAQLRDEGILKNGEKVIDLFNDGVEYLYQDHSEAILKAMADFLTSLPLAIRCPNGWMLCHSLPAPAQMESFDPQVLFRPLTDADLTRGGAAHSMVWGRHHTQDQADLLAAAWQCEGFIMGHQPAPMGYELEGDTMLILLSEDEHGQALPLELEERLTRDDLIDRLYPLAAVMLP